MSVVSIVGVRRSESTAGPGTAPAPAPSFGFHWCAPAGLSVAGVALIAQPGRPRAPVDVLVGLPHGGTAAGEAERLEAHRLERDVAGQDHQIRPRERLAVLLLDRPQQPASLVQVAVVRP